MKKNITHRIPELSVNSPSLRLQREEGMPYIIGNLMNNNYGMEGIDLVKCKQKFILASYHLNDFLR